jgi:hypothetical protein
MKPKKLKNQNETDIRVKGPKSTFGLKTNNVKTCHV